MDLPADLNLIRFGWALGLIVMALALVVWQQLGLEWTFLTAAGRMIGQLLVAGYVLAFVFALNDPVLVAIALLVMLLVVTLFTRNRISPKLPHLLPWVGGALFLSTAFTVSYSLVVVIRPDPWYAPQFWIPLTAILLSNAVTTAAIAGERFLSALNANALEIETHLSLGATPQQAIAAYRREALKAGLVPILNTMTIAGMVTLPGIYTGQLLGGANPFGAALLQILIFLMMALSTLIATILILQGIYRQHFNAAAQLTLH